jgi:hypothetical protein
MMRGFLRILTTGLAGLLLVLAVACGSGSSNGGNSDGSGADSGGHNAGSGDAGFNAPADQNEPEPAVLNAVEALGRSANDFQNEVQSLRGEMTMEMDIDEMSFGLNGDFAFKSPDQMHMRMEFSGGEGSIVDFSEFGAFELLLVDEKLYMNVPFIGGWTVATLDELGVDAQQYRDMVSNHSPFDYADLVESFGDGAQVNDLGEEEIDGKTYRHYRVESDLASLLDALDGAFGDELSGDGMFPVEGVGGAIVADVWLDSATLLPYKVTAEGSFTSTGVAGEPPAGAMTFKLTIVVPEYNGNVTIPAPPADARSFSELDSQMTPDE